MAYFYLDDSKHHAYGFSLAAFAICQDDPTEEVAQIFRTRGFDPATFEFKSSSRMAGNEKLQHLRNDLKQFIQWNCRIAVCVVKDDRTLGPAALKLLATALCHPILAGVKHNVVFDEGLFSSEKAAETLVSKDPSLRNVDFAFEQNSKQELGIQVADVVAHTCAIMLCETLSTRPKSIIWDDPQDQTYHGLEVPLEFEMWASLRFAFLSMNKPIHEDELGLAIVNVFPWGLYVDEKVDDRVTTAAFKRFGENYLGCCH